MNNVQYFFEKAIRSCKRGKFYYRPWKQLLTIVMLEIKCIILTVQILNEITKYE